MLKYQGVGDTPIPPILNSINGSIKIEIGLAGN
jgi:hypothetical protein